MQRSASVPFLSAALLLAAALPAQVLRVPSQYPTIAAALAAAGAGSRILVAAGTYAENLSWPAVDGIRLIGEGGAAATIVDGGAAGTVLAFGSGPTRATVVEGLTIRNGFLQNSSNRNYGAGVSINNCSPTIRHCRVTGNASDGIYWNYGGGFYITGAAANPLLYGNEIDNNELRNGSWNYGAGVYVASGARAEVVGNHIHDNRNLTVGTTSGGRGYGAGIFVDGSALIASNLIAGNLNNTTSWNYGGGVYFYSSGSGFLHNNTIAANTLTGGNWRYGGGVYVDGGATVAMLGNIVASNTGAGIYRGTTGTGTLSTDYDLVWGNSTGDYVNVTAGPNSLSVDPQFVGAADYHLRSTSPCVDAMPASHLTAVVDVDADGDPRRLDGDLDGGATDGARLDLGADEYTDARLSVTGAPQLGGSIAYSMAAAQPSLFVFAVALGTGNVVVEPFGNLLLGGAVSVLAVGVTPATVPAAIPNAPALVGLLVHSQALFSPLPPGAAGRFSNRVSVTVY